MSENVQPVDETTTTTPAEATPQAQPTQPEAQPSVPENPFEGIDTALWDEGGFKQAETIQALKDAKALQEKKDQQILGLRRIISKGVDTPNTAEEYSANYQPGKEFEKYYKDDGSVLSGFVADSMAEIDNMALEKGMNVAQAHAVKDLFNRLMKEVQIFPDESDEAKLRKAEYREKVLGKDAEDLIEGNKRAIANYNGWTDDEKNILIAALDKDPTLASALDKYRQLAFGSRGSIPAREYSNDTLPDDYTLATEYVDPKTTDHRREEIIEQRMKAGRTSPLPIALR